MGGFFYHAKPLERGLDHRRRYERSVQALLSKGLSESQTLKRKEIIDRAAFSIHVFGKVGADTENSVHFPEEEFLVVTGTLIYKNSTGAEALRELFLDFRPEAPRFDQLRGQFCALLYKQKALYVFTDFFGIYKVFVNDDHTVISSSFLAVVRSLETKTISEQALYEYVAEGATYADETYVRGVRMLDGYTIHQLQPVYSATVKQCDAGQLSGNTFDERVGCVVEQLMSHWNVLKGCFGQRGCIGLSGGYDSRLILALLMQAGIKPHVYVYGDARSPDVVVSKAIGRGEGILIHHDQKRVPTIDIDIFERNTRLEYFYCDGYGANGAFTNGAEMAARKHRTDAAPLQLNGGGGEIFRNFWKLPDRSMSVSEFLKSRYDASLEELFRHPYYRRTYLDALGEKVKRMLRTTADRLTRRQIEMLYIYMRVKYWMGHNVSIQNVRTSALIPLVEPIFAFPSWDIPVSDKELGRFEAALICSLNMRLASYTSVYGFNFLDGVPIMARVGNWMAVNTPVSMRPALRKLRGRLIRNRRKPFFLLDKYVNAVLTQGSWCAEFLTIAKIQDPLMLSRVHTVDLVMADPY